MTDVIVMDGTSATTDRSVVGRSVCAALENAGLRSRLGDPESFDAPLGVVLLPLQPQGVLPQLGLRFLAAVDALAGDPAARFTTRMVLVWCVPNHERRHIAAPRPVTGNAATLLLGNTWQRERGHHNGDEFAAVRCRNEQLVSLVRAHGAVGGTSAADLLARTSALDPHALHTMLVEVVDHGETGDARRWLDVAGVVATIRLRQVTPSCAMPLRTVRADAP
ncbi:hypothetical protein ACWGE0_43750 [Lentzea sp. NPDC054927]